MKLQKYKLILLFITITILATIALQIYWNLKNYQENKLRVSNEVQIAFDNSVENYYVAATKENYIGFVNDDPKLSGDVFLENLKIDTLFQSVKKNIKKRHESAPYKKTINYDAIKTNSNILRGNSPTIKPGNAEVTDIKMQINLKERNEKYKNETITSTSLSKSLNLNTINPTNISSIKIYKGKKSTDSLSAITSLTNKIIIAFSTDSIDLKKMSSFVNDELKRKKIVTSFQLQHLKADTVFASVQKKKSYILGLQTFSKSSYLKNNEKLKLLYSNPTLLVLSRSLTGIVLSLLLSLSIVGCLLYLLRIINQQKKLDAIKNDLISNITHEFKTPITTISSAIEGIKNFNSTNDIAKTDRYLTISREQISKLEVMVEKLLETASLNSNELILRKEKTDLYSLLKNNIEKYQLIAPQKNIAFNETSDSFYVDLDSFHFDNVISNLLDNAVKYGGNEIQISLKNHITKIEINIQDNGIGINANHEDKIFEQFYRIPKGNIHDVKGFGIGLYYSKKIIEKHGGTLNLVSNVNNNIFIISIPNE